MGPVLEVRNISKQFPGVKALDDVSMAFYPGEVHAIVGENGAGKSTLMKILVGAYAPDSGSILFNRRDATASHNGADGDTAAGGELRETAGLRVAPIVLRRGDGVAAVRAHRNCLHQQLKRCRPGLATGQEK